MSAKHHSLKAPPPPSVHPDCATCANPEGRRYTPNPGVYAFGDIVRLQESIHTPIQLIFNRFSPTTGSSSLPFARRRSKGKARPAVVLQPFDAGEVMPVQTCLMATYEGTHTYQYLPTILKHFCLPVSPHAELCDCPDHVHTSPEWQGYGWFIAMVYHSSGAVTGRWLWTEENGKRSKDSSFRIEAGRLRALLELCQEKLDDWQAWVREEPSRVKRCKGEYVVSVS